MKNLKRLLFALGFALPSTFIFKGQETDYSTKQLNILKEVQNQNKNIVVQATTEDGRYVRIPKRTINERGLERNKIGRTYQSKFTADELPYDGHNFTGDKEALLNEAIDLQTSSKKHLLETGEATYYEGGLRIYSKTPLSKEAKAIDSTLSFPMDGFAYPLGVYTAPGEIVDLYIPVKYEDYLFNSDVSSELSVSIGPTQKLINSGFDVQKASQITSIYPKRFTNFTSRELFKKDKTAVIDGERYFTAKIASPVGGPVYVAGDYVNEVNLELRAIGGLESRLYIYGSTSDEENEANYINTTAPYFDIITPLMRLSSEMSSKTAYTPDNAAKTANLWDQISNLSNYFNPAAGQNVLLFDRMNLVPGSGAYAFPSSHFAILPPSWLSIDYDSLMRNGGWGLMHEYNHIVERHMIGGNANLWIMNWRKGEFATNVITGFQYSLLFDVAKNRIDADDPFSKSPDSRQKIADPYSTLTQIYKNRFNKNTNLDHSWYVYLGVFHSLGLGIMAETQGFEWNTVKMQGDEKVVDADILYRGLSYKSGFDFSQYIEGVLKTTLSDSVKQEIKNKVCNTADGSTTPCNYPTFASTGSLYTRSNERVRSLEQWRKDIKTNVSKNGIPSYFSEKESIDSVKQTANYKMPKEYYLVGGQSSKEDSEAAVYKRTTTGQPFKLNGYSKQTLNLNPKLDSNNNLTGRIASTSDIKNVTLEWQEGNAITKTGEYTYEVDPAKVKSAGNDYDFAISVEYVDSSIPTEILYGTLYTDESQIEVKHYSAEGYDASKSNYAPFDQFGYDASKLDSSKYISSESTTQAKYSQNSISNKSNGVISLINFDMHFDNDTSMTVGISPVNGRAALVLNESDGTKKKLIGRTDTSSNKHSDGNYNLNVKAGTKLSFTLFFYSYPNTNGNVYMTYESNGRWLDIPTSMLSPVGYTKEKTKLRYSSIYAEKFQSIKTNQSDHKLTRDEASLISYGYFQKGHTVADKYEDQEAFNNQYFTKFNKYDPNISENDLNTLNKTFRVLSDGNYIDTNHKATSIRYDNVQQNYGALYFTYENTKNTSINQIKLRDEQILDSSGANNLTNSPVDGTIGDVSIYVGDKLDVNGSPVLSEYTKVKSHINNDTWYISGLVSGAMYAKNKVATRTIELDNAVTNKYIVLKIENGQKNTGTKDGNFTLADIEFHSNMNLGSTYYTDVAFTNPSVKYYGTWQVSNDLNTSKREVLKGTKGDYLGFSFYGSKLSLSINQFDGAGKLRIIIDGKAYEVDTSSSQIVYDNSVFQQELQTGDHLVTVEVLDGNVELTRFGFNSTAFNAVTQEVLKDQIDTYEESQQPENPNPPVDPDKPVTPDPDPENPITPPTNPDTPENPDVDNPTNPDDNQDDTNPIDPDTKPNIQTVDQKYINILILGISVTSVLIVSLIVIGSIASHKRKKLR